jgi:phospholipid/cholesterol/gamma-HCH transport system substrate-binding protein
MVIKKEVKAGLLVIVSLALLVFGFNFLKGRNLFDTQRTFHAVYERVDGLTASNPVILNGLGVGQVTNMKLVPGADGFIVVTFTINVGELDVPKNSVAKIVSQDLLGSKAIELHLGSSTQMALNGDTILAEVQVSLTEEVNRQVGPLRAKAESLISSMDSVMMVVQQLLSREVVQNLEKSVISISRTIHSIEKTALRIDTVIGEERHRIKAIMKNVESISTNFRENNNQLSAIISNFNNISDSLAKANIASTINNADRTLAQTNQILEKINRGEGSIGMLINNDTLYRNLENSSLNLDRLMEDLRLNPHRYLHFSIIGRKERAVKK